MEVSKQDLEETSTSAGSSAPRSLTLCKPSLGAGLLPGSGNIPYCTSPASPKDIRLPDHSPASRTSGSGYCFSRNDPFLSPKGPYTAVCKGFRHFNHFKWMSITWARRGSLHRAPSCSHHQQDVAEPKAVAGPVLHNWSKGKLNGQQVKSTRNVRRQNSSWEHRSFEVASTML